MERDDYNRKDYSAVYFAILLVFVAAYIILKDLGII